MIILIPKFIFGWLCNLPLERTPPLSNSISPYPWLSKAMTTKVTTKKSGKIYKDNMFRGFFG